MICTISGINEHAAIITLAKAVVAIATVAMQTIKRELMITVYMVLPLLLYY